MNAVCIYLKTKYVRELALSQGFIPYRETRTPRAFEQEPARTRDSAAPCSLFTLNTISIISKGKPESDEHVVIRKEFAKEEMASYSCSPVSSNWSKKKTGEPV